MNHFFDIGANVGQTFDWLATQPHDYKDHLFWCFEPSPRHFAALIAKCREQAAKGYRINLCPFGLADMSYVAKLYEKDDPQGDSFAEWTKSDHVPANRHGEYAVMGSMRSLSRFICEFTKPSDSIMLDIDAEGGEYAMLADLLANTDARLRVKRIMVEFHFVAGGDCRLRKQNFIDRFARKGLPLEVRGFVQ